MYIPLIVIPRWFRCVGGLPLSAIVSCLMGLVLVLHACYIVLCTVHSNECVGVSFVVPSLKAYGGLSSYYSRYEYVLECHAVSMRSLDQFLAGTK